MQNLTQPHHGARGKLQAAAWLCASSALFLLAGCGGGDLGDAASTPSVAQTPPVVAGTCTKTNTKIGQVAKLSTRAHNVSGEAKIIDDCTIEISNFNYDGGGLSKVFAYGGKGGDYVNGFPMGENLVGKVFSSPTLKITLQPGDLDKLDGISIWCADVKANFGDGLFAVI